MMFPVKIQKLRINVSIKHFYDDLEAFCKTMKWDFKQPNIFPKEKSTDTILWKNNLVSFSEKSKYPNGSIKEILITYTIPSFIGPPSNTSDKFEGLLLPKISFKHAISLTLPNEYPANVARTHIQAVSTLWHNNFYYLQNRFSHGCVLVSGEIDGMAMNLFQQLLWNPDFVWQNAHKMSNFSLNKEALQYGKIKGNEFPYRALISKMNEKFGV